METPGADGRSPFWAFSLRTYGRPGVPEACLALQDGCGADVNVALFLLWHAAEGRGLSPEDLARIEALVGAWRREVVARLREVRRALKLVEAEAGVAPLRRQVKQAELEAERLQQEILFREARSLGYPARRGEAARGNLARYAVRLGTIFPQQPVDMLIEAALG